MPDKTWFAAAFLMYLIAGTIGLVVGAVCGWLGADAKQTGVLVMFVVAFIVMLSDLLAR